MGLTPTSHPSECSCREAEMGQARIQRADVGNAGHQQNRIATSERSLGCSWNGRQTLSSGLIFLRFIMSFKVKRLSERTDHTSILFGISTFIGLGTACSKHLIEIVRTAPGFPGRFSGDAEFWPEAERQLR